MPTGIEWTEETWNPIRGCSKVSEGCRNCYAERMAARFSGPGMPYEGLVKYGRWTGAVKLDYDALKKPLHWKKPRKIFVNSMSDLFHEEVEFDIIHEVWDVMKACPQHIFQVLTKQPYRMKDDISRIYRLERLGYSMGFWSHVWLGVSVENQKAAEVRIPLLLQTPAALRFVSCEPLLEYTRIFSVLAKCKHDGLPPIDWVIIGAESGPVARTMDLEWARAIVRNGYIFDVPVFVKQLCHNGRKIPFEQWPKDLKVRQWPEEKP